jgi:ribulose-5-phosphate 4-epimerase/fuculose-1-phosphate aldolase
MAKRYLAVLVGFVGVAAVAAAGIAVTTERVHAQPATAAPAAPAVKSPDDARAKAIADVVAANHILANEGVVDGYGHVSIRDPGDPTKFLMARSVAPELVTAADVVVHDAEGNVATPNVKLYAERFIHSEIYRARPDVNAIVHCHSPSLIPFGVTGLALRPLYHMSSFLGGGVPVFDIRKAAGGPTDMLIRTPVLGHALAQSLGPHPAALMRGHGAVIVGRDIQQAVFRSVYTELNAKLQSQAIALGTKVIYLDAEEAKMAEQSNIETLARPWDLWLRKVKAK